MLGPSLRLKKNEITPSSPPHTHTLGISRCIGEQVMRSQRLCGTGEEAKNISGNNGRGSRWGIMISG